MKEILADLTSYLSSAGVTTKEKKYTFTEFLDYAKNKISQNNSYKSLLLSKENSFLGVKPTLIIKIKNYNITLETADFTRKIDIPKDNKEDAQNYLWTFLFNITTLLENILKGKNSPLYNGYTGFFAYEFGKYIEDLPEVPDSLNCDDFTLLLFTHFYSYHENENILRSYDLNLKPISRISKSGKKTLESAGSDHKYDYLQKLAKVKEYIRQGDIYQVNISQRFSLEYNNDSFKLFLDLFQRNPADFFAYLDLLEYQIVSTSPERFIKLDGKHIETKPIKGTINRGNTLLEDEQNKSTLLNSEKDKAELAMITDLMRNDLGRVSDPGSVKVSKNAELETYKNVYHLVSTVESILAKDKTWLDLIKATFPGGSITGCPKIRSMEIISEIEKEARGIYTGSIFFKSFQDYFDSNIAIRTIYIKEGQAHFRVGGGIVYDSVPLAEYEETIHKGQTIMESLGIDHALYLEK